jgi:hypothetical protein
MASTTSMAQAVVSIQECASSSSISPDPKILYDYTYAGSQTVDCNGICTEATSVAATFRGIVWIAGTNTEVPLKDHARRLSGYVSEWRGEY